METATILYIIYSLLTLMVLAGIWMMSRVELAKQGNRFSAIAMLLAVGISLWQAGISTLVGMMCSILLGLVLGLRFAQKVQMIQMPQLVALLNGLGGAASALVGGLFLLNPEMGEARYLSFNMGSAFLAIVIGLITLVGSLVAAGKLHRVLAQKPVVYPMHQILSALCIGMCVGVVFVGYNGGANEGVGHFTACLAILAPIAFGWLFAIRVGGADMPITISLLNSLSGLAGAIAGLATGDIFLVAVGGIVGASGLLLTQIMCRAMNRSLIAILFAQDAPKPKQAQALKSEEVKQSEVLKPVAQDDLGSILRKAREVIIVPGYGMALSQAQADVYALAEKLKAQGARVRYAIHPVAGRMPGHMNVLLSEAGVDYEEQIAMDDINDDFKTSDLVVVIGANDVLNPAARNAEGTPIYGMPVLSVDEAKHVVICNFDLNPGYAGVPNPLYTRAEGVHLLLGDAKESVRSLIQLLSEPLEAVSTASEQTSIPLAKSSTEILSSLLPTIKNVIIVPGYGMALSQAQHEVRSLAQKFIAQGARVRYAIHPVAGRMPGHMNVLLCEADVAYEDLYEMDSINDDFKTSDLVVVIGANDVLNPAARNAEGTPIYGMPVLSVDEAKHVVICNFDLNPGYAGVPNPLYTRAEGVHLLLGDAKESVRSLIAMLG